VNAQVPLDLCNKLMGIAICAVFIFQEHQPVNQPNWRYSKIIHELLCSIRTFLYLMNFVRLNCITFGCNIFPLYFSIGAGNKHWIELMLMDLVRLRSYLKLMV